MFKLELNYETRFLLVGVVLLVLIGLVSEPAKNFNPVQTIKSAVKGPEKFQAVKFFRLGEINEIIEITLGSREKAIHSPAPSPLGVNFQVNQCSGYLNQFLAFDPPLPSECPAPDLSALNPELPANQECLEFIKTVPACTTPLTFPANLSLNCQNFIKEEFNYNACFDTHKNDTDFLLPEWRVYAN